MVGSGIEDAAGEGLVFLETVPDGEVDDSGI